MTVDQLANYYYNSHFDTKNYWDWEDCYEKAMSEIDNYLFNEEERRLDLIYFVKKN
jgi:hypothetical protein